MIKRMLSLLSLSLFLTSCAMNAAKNYGEIRLEELKNDPNKYGVVLFKSIYLPDRDSVIEYIKNENSFALSSSSSASIFAKKINDEKYGLFYFGYQIGGSWTGSDEYGLKKKKFTLQKYEASWNKPVPEIVMPEYFYTLKMLPVGRYYFSRIVAGVYESNFGREDTPYVFDVKPGCINYLGDFFIFSPKKESLWTGTYHLGTKLIFNPFKAQSFMKEYHPEIGLPFVNNLILMNR